MASPGAAALLFEALAGAHVPPNEGVVLLAVSGGPDSMAMMALARDIREALLARGIAIEVATVDHGLRPTSATEAERVASTAGDLGFTHRILRWRGAKPASNLQAAARRARYDLLETHAREICAGCVLTAHHEDDQIETHLLARLRRAGDRGLAGMRERRELGPGVLLLRPFLGIPGRDLRIAATVKGLPVVDDPSNRDERFQRVRLRNELKSFAPQDRSELLAAIARHRVLRDRSDRAIASALRGGSGRAGVTIDDFGTVRADASAFGTLSAADRADLLGRIIAAVAGAEHPPERRAIERLLDGWSEVRGAATLGGAGVRFGAELAVFREFGRSGPEAVAFERGDAAVAFDRRFTVTLEEDASFGLGAGCRLVALGALGRGNAAERTMPVLVDPAGRSLAVPEVLARKQPAPGRLRLRSRVAWSLQADLPRGDAAT